MKEARDMQAYGQLGHCAPLAPFRPVEITAFASCSQAWMRGWGSTLWLLPFRPSRGSIAELHH
jgi:hypothetical protein